MPTLQQLQRDDLYKRLGNIFEEAVYNTEPGELPARIVDPVLIGAKVTAALAADPDFSGWTIYDGLNGIVSTAEGLDAIILKKGDEVLVFAQGQDLYDSSYALLDQQYSFYPILSDLVPKTAWQMRDIYKQLEENLGQNAKITLSGHSLGGGIAQLAGALLHNENDLYKEKVEVVTYASTLAAHLIDNLGLNFNNNKFTSYVNTFDINTGQYYSEGNNDLILGNIYFTKPTSDTRNEDFLRDLSYLTDYNSIFRLLTPAFQNILLTETHGGYQEEVEFWDNSISWNCRGNIEDKTVVFYYVAA